MCFQDKEDGRVPQVPPVSAEPRAGTRAGRTCRASDVERQGAQAEAAAEAEGLPQLTGTPKQIVWGVTLRHKALSDADAYLDYLRETGQLKGRVATDREFFEAQKERVLESLRVHSEAAWWIDRRYDSPETLLASLWAEE